MSKKNQVNNPPTRQSQRNWILVSTLPTALAILLYIASDFIFSTTGDSSTRYPVRVALFVISIVAVGLSIMGVFKAHGWTKILSALCILLGCVLLLWIGAVLILSSTDSFTF